MMGNNDLELVDIESQRDEAKSLLDFVRGPEGNGEGSTRGSVEAVRLLRKELRTKGVVNISIGESPVGP